MCASGLKTKLMLGAVLLVALPLLAVGWFAFDQASREVRKLALEGAANTSHHLAELLAMTLGAQLRLVGEMAGQRGVVQAAEIVADNGVDVPRAEVHGLTREMTKSLKIRGGDLRAIMAVNTQGVIFADSLEGQSKGSPLEDGSFLEGLRKGPGLSQVFADGKSGRPALYAGAPILGMDKTYLGAVVVRLDLNQAARFLGETRLGQTGYIFLIDGRGMVVAHPDPAVALKLNITQVPGMEQIAQRMLAGQSGVQDYVYKDFAKVASFAPVPLAGWSVAATQGYEELLSASRFIRGGVLVIGLVALLAAVLGSLPLIRRIVGPVQAAADQLGRASGQLKDTSRQVSGSSHHLAESACEQAASLEETSSGLSQMASLVQNTTRDISQADLLMGEASQAAQTAQTGMDELRQTMGRIAQAGERITGVVTGIENIAFQTNLLALNAAVEAARAGEHGNGFAVVADEVRKLALRSSEDAKRTQDLVETALAAIKEGLERVSSTSQSFAAVERAVQRVTGLLGGISRAAEEESQGINQLNQAMMQIEQVVQANTTHADQGSSAATLLEGQAQALAEVSARLLALVGGAAARAGGEGRAQRRRPAKEAAQVRDEFFGPQEPARIVTNLSRQVHRIETTLLPGGGIPALREGRGAF